MDFIVHNSEYLVDRFIFLNYYAITLMSNYTQVSHYSGLFFYMKVGGRKVMIFSTTQSSLSLINFNEIRASSFMRLTVNP